MECSMNYDCLNSSILAGFAGIGGHRTSSATII
jgi:hypothetical protein